MPPMDIPAVAPMYPRMTEATKAITIIIDNYNQELFLREAIESALAQNPERASVMVIDDGSTDGSKRRCVGKLVGSMRDVRQPVDRNASQMGLHTTLL